MYSKYAIVSTLGYRKCYRRVLVNNILF